MLCILVMYIVMVLSQSNDVCKSNIDFEVYANVSNKLGQSTHVHNFMDDK